MAGVSKQKQKLLVMEQLFRQRTDEAHAITGNQLIDILKTMDIKAERKTIYDDIATLCDAGLDIRTTKSGHSNAYYMAQRLFDDEELKILADLTASSRYLTIKRANEIIRKLQSLTSEHKAAVLKRSISVESRTKSSGENIFSLIDIFAEAITADLEVEVFYSDDGEKKKQGEKITVSPYNILCEGDVYYILCGCAGEILKLCADRMNEPVLGKNKRHSPSEEENRLLKMLKEFSVKSGADESQAV